MNIWSINLKKGKRNWKSIDLFYNKKIDMYFLTNKYSINRNNFCKLLIKLLIDKIRNKILLMNSSKELVLIYKKNSFT